MSEAELTLLALLEGLAAAQRMGAPLPLAAYMRAYPQHADVLLEYGAALWSGDVDALAPASPPVRTALSAGTRHALAQLFSDMESDTNSDMEAPERLVAERPGEYVTRAASTPESPDGSADGAG